MDIKAMAERWAEEIEDKLAIPDAEVKAVVVLCITKQVNGEPATLFAHSVGDSHLKTLGALTGATALLTRQMSEPIG